MSLRLLRLLWALVLLGSLGHLGWRLAQDIPIGTDLLALVPHEESDEVVAKARARVDADLAGRLVFLVGHEDPAIARAAAGEMAEALARSGLVRDLNLPVREDTAQRLAAHYFPHRFALLAPGDRERLLAGAGEELRDRALAQIFGVGAGFGQRVLASDPFLLFPNFLLTLPLPSGKMRLTEGYPGIEEAGRTYILLGARTAASAFALEGQSALVRLVAATSQSLNERHAGLTILKAGVPFHAEAGGRKGLAEARRIGILSLAGAFALFLLLFHSPRQFLLGLLSVAAGLGFALSLALALFEELHVVAIMFGASLVGVSVDYSIHYFTSALGGTAGTPEERLRRILPGLSLGLATSLAGYLTLLLAPLPGLHQIAAISSLGLAGAFLTVLLFLPLLDRGPAPRHARALPRHAAGLWRLWNDPARRPARRALLSLVIAAALAGIPFIAVDDDVRNLQSRDRALVEEEGEIRRMTGSGLGGSYFLIVAATGDEALGRAESLAERLEPLLREGALEGLTSAAAFLPSRARQEENRRLVRERLLEPHLKQIEDATGLRAELAGEGVGAPPSLSLIAREHPLLAGLLLEPDGRIQLALPAGIRDAAALRAAIGPLEGIHFVDPVSDISALFARYRERALWLIGCAALVIVTLIAARYGPMGAVRVMLAPILALLATTPILALFGLPLTFFGAMALVLVLAIGMDYALFSRETPAGHEGTTMLAILVAAATTLLSFGLLALSEIAAVRSFGATMLTGILIAVILAPLAGRRKQ